MTNHLTLNRIVKPFGNGAHVSAPKEWIGEQVSLVKSPEKDVKDRIFDQIGPYLDLISGVYLYGSYSRGEQDENSDIDLLLITNEKINLKAEGFDITSLRVNDLDKAIRLNPVLIYSILSEAKPIINSSLLAELKVKYKPKLSDFKPFLNNTMGMIKVNQDFLDAEKSDILSSEAIVYSLVLRLRALFIISSLLERDEYSNKSFRAWIKYKLPQIDFDTIYNAYRNSKRDEKIKDGVRVYDIERLLEFLKKEVLRLKNG